MGIASPEVERCVDVCVMNIFIQFTDNKIFPNASPIAPQCDVPEMLYDGIPNTDVIKIYFLSSADFGSGNYELRVHELWELWGHIGNYGDTSLNSIVGGFFQCDETRFFRECVLQNFAAYEESRWI